MADNVYRENQRPKLWARRFKHFDSRERLKQILAFVNEGLLEAGVHRKDIRFQDWSSTRCTVLYFHHEEIPWNE